MPGQLKVGGNVIAEHTGIEGAGEVSLQNITIGGGQLGGMRNLIINGNFQVNQRGAASITATTSDYNYDRWYYDGTYLYQGVEDKNVFNGTYTLSWVDAGSDITASYVVSTDTTAGDGPDSGQTWTTVSNGGNITVNEATEYSKHLWVRFGGTLSNLSKVQVEYGAVATPFEHRPYGLELSLCQRYYNQFDTTEGGAIRVYEVYGTTGGGDCNFCLGIHKPMRVAPTVTATGNSTANISGYGGLVSEQGTINVAGSYTAAGRTYWYQSTADANGQRLIKIDAEL